MKKAFTWLDHHHIEYTFHDYKKNGIDESVIQNSIATHGWEKVINTRGMTWRKVPDDVKTTMNDQSAITLAAEKPSVVKRPLIVNGNDILLGFDDVVYENKLKN